MKRFLCPGCLYVVLSDNETESCPRCKTMMIAEIPNNPNKVVMPNA